MKIRELIFQGIYALSQPVRLAGPDDISGVALPEGVTTAEVQDLLIALLFPEHTPFELASQLRSSDTAKLAVVVEQGGKRFRILRRGGADSFRLQAERDGKFHTVVKGREAVERALVEKLGRGDFAAFAAVNLWRFDDAGLFGQGGVDLEHLPQQAREIAEQYLVAVRVEALEDAIQTTQAEVDQAAKHIAEGLAVEEKLGQARAKYDQLELRELSDKDMELLRDKDHRLGGFEEQVNRLAAEEAAEREEVEALLPEKPWKQPNLWYGVIIGVAALVGSVGLGDDARAVALFDVVGFGMVAWVMLKYFTDLERASVHQVRLDTIKRRLNQVREEKVGFQEKLSHLLIHAGASDENELFDRVAKIEKLEAIVDKLSERLAQVEADPEYKASRKRIGELEERLETLRAERAELPEYVMSTFQLEDDLKTLGVDAAAVLAASERAEADEDEPDAFARLTEVARAQGQFHRGLEARAQKMWAKICGHVLGDRFKSVGLTDAGELTVGSLTDEQLEMWRRTRASEQHIAACGLALALHVSAGDGDGYVETVWVPDPDAIFASDAAEKFHDVFKSAARKSHLVLCQA